MAYEATQVEQAIEGHDDFDGWGEIKWAGKDNVALEITLDGQTVPVYNADSYGGEGQGDEIWVVVKVGDQYFEKSGYYASHYGTDWDGPFREVTPVEKIVTVYESR